MKVEKDKIEGALIGMVLGDACLLKSKQSKNAWLRIQHCAKQKKYLDAKAEILAEITKVRTIPIDKKYPAYVLNTRSNPVYTRLHNYFYKNGVKVVDAFIANKLNDIGLALWYQDDGHLSLHKSYNKSGIYRIDRRRVFLHTEGYDKASNEILQSMLRDNFGLEFRIYHKCKRWYHLIGNPETAKKLFAIVAPYIVPSMKYKIELSYQLSDEKPLNEGDDIVRPAWQHAEHGGNDHAAQGA